MPFAPIPRLLKSDKVERHHAAHASRRGSPLATDSIEARLLTRTAAGRRRCIRTSSPRTCFEVAASITALSPMSAWTRRPASTCTTRRALVTKCRNYEPGNVTTPR